MIRHRSLTSTHIAHQAFRSSDVVVRPVIFCLACVATALSLSGCNRVAPLIQKASKSGQVKRLLGFSDDAKKAVDSTKKAVANPATRLAVMRLTQLYREAEQDRQKEEALFYIKYSRLSSADQQSMQSRIDDSQTNFPKIGELLAKDDAVSEEQSVAISDYLSDYTESSKKIQSFLQDL